MSGPKLATLAGARAEIEEWADPIPFAAELAGPDCPVDVFPRVLREYIRELAESVQVDPSMAAAPVLAVVAAAAARRARVAIGRTHVEPLNLYFGTVAAPSERKSPVIREAVEPLRVAEAELIEAARDTLAKNHQQRAGAEGRIRHLHQQIGRCDEAQERATLVREAAEIELEMPDEMAEPRLLLGDVTPEALIRSLADQGGRAAIISEEGGTLVGIASGRYDRSGAPNLDALLSAYDGGRLRVDRIGRSSNLLEDPALTISVMLQPSMLDSIGGVGELRGRGLIARVAWTWPRSLVGGRTYRDRPISASARAEYHALVHRLLELPSPAEAGEAMTLSVESEALTEWARYADELEIQQAPGGPLAAIADWAGKHSGRVARIAGLLHLVEHVGGSVPARIAPGTVAAAVEIGRWLTGHALAVLERIGADPAVAECQRILAWARGRERLSLRDLHRALYQSRLQPEDLKPYLEALEARGYLRRLEAEGNKTGRRRSPMWLVHPSLRGSSVNSVNSVSVSTSGRAPLEMDL